MEPTEIFNKMLNDGTAEYHADHPVEPLRVSQNNPESLIKATQELHLDVDTVSPSQRYILMSFIDPEEILDVKEVFIFGKFLDRFANDLTNIFVDMEERIPELRQRLKTLRLDTYKQFFEPKFLQNTYRYFKKDNYETLSQEFYKLNNFRTSERGIKIRGAFGSIEEAQNQAKRLMNDGNAHNIFVGEMGHWFPFNPPIDKIKNQEYMDDELNTLMKSHKDQQIKQEQAYEDRKLLLKELVELKEKEVSNE